MAFNWVCPYCLYAQAVGANRFLKRVQPLQVEGMAEGAIALESRVIVCSNPVCARTTIDLRIGKYQSYRNPNAATTYELIDEGMLFSERVAPRSHAKPQPSFIPKPLIDDYTEACLIRDLSPKASATLTRRCLQGMIRDFAGITRGRLIDEITSLKTAVEDGTADRAITLESVAAIDHVRSVGNIGAHMESDINMIVPVDNGEAQALIELIELLFDEWYGARNRRQQQLAKIASIRAGKDGIKREQKKDLKPTSSN